MTAHEWEKRDLRDKNKIRYTDEDGGYLVCLRCDMILWVDASQTTKERMEEIGEEFVSPDCDVELVGIVMNK